MGSPWRDVPQCYGPWQTVYGLFRRWQRAGVWQRIVAGLQTRADAAGLIGWDVSVDSTIARAHQHAAGARTQPERQKEPPGGVEDEPADHALGRSRGGWTTKVHLACEQGRKPLAMLVTGGQRGDSPQFSRVLACIRVPRAGGGRPRTRPDRVLADKAYSSRGNPGGTTPTWHPGDHPDQDRPGRQPAQERCEGRPATDHRPHRLPPASRRRVRHQPAQTPPSYGHQIRQTRCALPGHAPRRRDQRMALKVPPVGPQNLPTLRTVNKRQRKKLIKRLMEAVLREDAAIANAALRVGADPNAADREGTTPLYQASVHGAVDLVRLLLAAGAAPDTESGHGREGTPLCAAAAWGHTDVVQELLAHDADPNLREDRGTGYSPLDWALRGDHSQTANLLLAAGAYSAAADI